jgi:hypothetical protein
MKEDVEHHYHILNVQSVAEQLAGLALYLLQKIPADLVHLSGMPAVKRTLTIGFTSVVLEL